MEQSLSPKTELDLMLSCISSANLSATETKLFAPLEPSEPSEPSANTGKMITPTHFLYLDFVYRGNMNDATKSTIRRRCLEKLNEFEYAMRLDFGDTVSIAWAVENIETGPLIWTVSRLASGYVHRLTSRMLQIVIKAVQEELRLETGSVSIGMVIAAPIDVTVVGSIRSD